MRESLVVRRIVNALMLTSSRQMGLKVFIISILLPVFQGWRVSVQGAGAWLFLWSSFHLQVWVVCDFMGWGVSMGSLSCQASRFSFRLLRESGLVCRGVSAASGCHLGACCQMGLGALLLATEASPSPALIKKLTCITLKHWEGPQGCLPIFDLCSLAGIKIIVTLRAVKDLLGEGCSELSLAASYSHPHLPLPESRGLWGSASEILQQLNILLDLFEQKKDC